MSVHSIHEKEQAYTLIMNTSDVLFEYIQIRHGYFFIYKKVYVYLSTSPLLLDRRVYKERLGIPPKMTIGYQSHTDTATKSGSTTKNKYVV